MHLNLNEFKIYFKNIIKTLYSTLEIIWQTVPSKLPFHSLLDLVQFIRENNNEEVFLEGIAIIWKSTIRKYILWLILLFEIIYFLRLSKINLLNFLVLQHFFSKTFDEMNSQNVVLVCDSELHRTTDEWRAIELGSDAYKILRSP